MKIQPRRLLYPVFAFLLVGVLSACGGGGGSTLTVNSANNNNDGVCDASHCSLYEAIKKANILAGLTTIKFNIGGGGVQTIHPLAPLPIISRPVFIDGTSQPGYVSHPLIELDGSWAADEFVDGLVLTGGDSSVRGLAINKFTFGIRLEKQGNNLIQGCYLGTDVTGTIAKPNWNAGVLIHSGSGNTIGGGNSTFRNVISGNHYNGILIKDVKNTVIGNYIGTDATGMLPLGNGLSGIVLQGGSNAIGGGTPNERNVISANGENGILIDAMSEKDFVEGNYIGMDKLGMGALSNHSVGILVAGNENQIGGIQGITGNVISANSGDGVMVNGLYNAVQGNLIGVNSMGSAALGNGGHGVSVHGNLNQVGGGGLGNGNVISANEGDGVHVTGGSIQIEGNFIGTDRLGSAPLGNHENGIFTVGMGGVLIGGTDPGSRNLISANQLVGIYIDDSSNGVDVYGNQIGTDLTGTAALGNLKAGIRAGGTNHRIGLPKEGGRNLISGNLGPGVAVLSTATGITIRNNYIGTDINGTAALGNSNGIEVGMGTGPTDVTIGGSPYGEGNLISGNDGEGVLLYSGANVRGNIIGADNTGLAALGNGANGILIKGPENEIGGIGYFNIIAFNGGHGVAVISESGVATGNPILTNSIHDNGGLGIAIDEDAVITNDIQDPDAGDNNRQNYPWLLSAVTDPIAVETNFTGALNSTPGTVFTVEFFSNASCDPSGYGEGHRWLKQISVTTDINGNASLLAHFPGTIFSTGNYITATATDPAGNTSGFSNCIPVTEKAAATETPAVTEMTFKPFFEPAEIFYGPRCTPDKVRISVEIGNPPEPIAYVLLFVRLMDQKTGEKTAWGGGLSMLAAGKNIFYYDLMAYDVPDYDKFESVWLQYQFVVYNKAQEKIGYSEVYGDITFTRCGSNSTRSTRTPDVTGK